MSVFFEDFTIGETNVLGAYAFERDAIIAFARLYDPQPFHLDEDAAKATIYGGLVASGWHTASGFMRCFIDWLDRRRQESAARGEAGAREAGRFRLEGKDYLVADGDVLHFRFAN